MNLNEVLGLEHDLIAVAQLHTLFESGLESPSESSRRVNPSRASFARTHPAEALQSRQAHAHEGQAHRAKERPEECEDHQSVRHLPKERQLLHLQSKPV